MIAALRRDEPGVRVADARRSHRSDKADRDHVKAELEKTDMDLVDMTARLVRLEAEVGIYKPLFDDKGSK
jgi:hypothetical protein